MASLSARELAGLNFQARLKHIGERFRDELERAAEDHIAALGASDLRVRFDVEVTPHYYQRETKTDG